ncbi:MAG: CRTAC1 family protein, partial [Marinicellaceae bacterium]
EGGWGWGTTFVDINNNSYLDIAATNGWQLNGWEEPPRLFINNPLNIGVFEDKAVESGMVSDHWGSSLLTFDMDRDGDLDLIESVSDACFNNRPAELRVALYANQLDNSKTNANYIVIKPRINGGNSRAIGAKIEIKFNGRTLTRWINAGTSFLGQEPAEAFFGVAETQQIDSIQITWPDGNITSNSNVPVNQVLTMFYTPKLFYNGFEAP